MKIIRGKQPGAKKVVVYGPEGIGKSTFASRFPDPVFIDTEGSTKDMDVARTETPTSWTMLLDQIKYVKLYPDICRTLVIDTTDWAEQMCVKHICDKYGKSGIEDFGYGNGYTYTREEFGRFLNLLSDVIDVGVNVVLTAHAQLKKFEQPDEMGAYDRWELKLGKKTTSQTSPLVKEWTDMLLFANYKTHSVAVDEKGQKRKAQGGRRVMYTSHHPCWDAKNRYGLPEEMDFDYAGIAHIIESAGNRPLQQTRPEPVQEPPKTGQNTQKPEQTQPEPMQEVPAENAQPAPEDNKDSALYIDERIPKALRDLMIANTVSEEEIQAICEARMYVPTGTPMHKYTVVNPELNDRIVVYWEQIFKEVKEMREKQEIPFN